ncbi:MAG TPA: hypothetical protein VHU40_06265 [Polyangia bacterium]|jgi:hypothetical protein|nr:hypothetical protein [Polyangia bacterium]
MTTLPFYATIEDVKEAPDFKETARADRRIMRALENASRSIEGLCHRRFYPETATRYFDWPTGARPWRVWLDDSELISVATLSSGGTTIASTDYFLEPNRTGPPYNRIEIDLSSSAAFGGGSTHQRDVTVTGLFGYRNDETVVETVTEALDASETEVQLHNSADIGVGSLIRIDDERMIITGRAALTTGGGIGDDLTASVASVRFLVDTGTHFHAGETILIDSERMLVVDIAGDFLTVKRAWDGSVLATHTTGADVYRYNSFTVVRGALGTTAAAHNSGATVYRWDPPGPVRSLCVAEALVELAQGQAAYARTSGSGENQRETSGRGLADLRAQVYRSHGRKARVRSV